jgi:hypothetical protein
MKAGLLGLGASLLVFGAIAVTVVDAQGRQSRSRRGWDDGNNFNFNIQTHRDGQPVTSCGQIEASVRNGELARDEETQTVPAPAQLLQVMAATNGGLFVVGADRADYQITLCKFGAGQTGDEARQRVSELSLTNENGRIGVNGPQSNGYMAYLIVEAPREARLSAEVTNGPLDVRSVSGHIVARTTNGPLSVSEVSGEVDVQATNGPVSLNRGSGHVRVAAQNGPLSVSLSGTDWKGSGLDASAQNGPLHLALPEGYQSGVLVDIAGNGPFSCNYSACRGASRDWDDHSRRLRFGNTQGNPIVRVTASNGPVSIGSGQDQD